MQLEAFCCPRCKSAKLTFHNSERSEITCGECAHVIPSFDKLFCFSPAPDAYKNQWQARYTNLIAAVTSREASARENLDERPPLTGARLDRVFASQKKNLERISKLLPELLAGHTAPSELTEIATAKISRQLSFENFRSNIFRDWVWGDHENAAAINSLKPYIEKSDGFIAVLGSGCGRLATDIARLTTGEVYATDLNPLFLRIHALMVEKNAQPIEFDEIPANPRDFDHLTITQRLQPKPCDNVFALIMNGINPTFRRGGLDLIVASWFIDVIPEDFARLTARLNAALNTNGKLIIHGPIGFSNSSEARAYTRDEIAEILALNGYKVEDDKTVEYEYLNSEFNPQKRFEEIKVIVARKIKSVKEPADFRALPDWLMQTNKPIPPSAQIANLAAQMKLRYEILASVDGKHSFDDIAQLVARQYKISLSEARNIMATILAEYFELA